MKGASQSNVRNKILAVPKLPGVSRNPGRFHSEFATKITMKLCTETYCRPINAGHLMFVSFSHDCI